jgi:uncharacterized lipoprotein YajG
MKLKILAVVGLAAIAGLAGCKSAANTNTNTNMNANSNMNMNTNMATPKVAAADPTMKSAVEAAMKKANLNDVTVEATTEEVTIRGTVPKGKMAQVNQIAQETAKRKVVNQVTEK